MILGNALSRILLNPIFLAHTSLKEHALTQTPSGTQAGSYDDSQDASLKDQHQAQTKCD